MRVRRSLNSLSLRADLSASERAAKVISTEDAVARRVAGSPVRYQR